ncbi:hypothetical protein EDC04DRAFT_2608980 [Pisolithus marmoratus]|nr:hypothetical protein EDC04DRAFT_2608980 [Pisolithus marmoratus]
MVWKCSNLVHIITLNQIQFTPEAKAKEGMEFFIWSSSITFMWSVNLGMCLASLGRDHLQCPKIWSHLRGSMKGKGCQHLNWVAVRKKSPKMHSSNNMSLLPQPVLMPKDEVCTRGATCMQPKLCPKTRSTHHRSEEESIELYCSSLKRNAHYMLKDGTILNGHKLQVNILDRYVTFDAAGDKLIWMSAVEDHATSDANRNQQSKTLNLSGNKGATSITNRGTPGPIKPPPVTMIASLLVMMPAIGKQIGSTIVNKNGGALSSRLDDLVILLCLVPPVPMTLGPLPEKARDKAVVLGERTIAEADEIAREFGKQSRTVLVEAGLAVKPTCVPSSWNMHQLWFGQKYPIKANGKVYVFWHNSGSCQKAEGRTKWSVCQRTHFEAHKDEEAHPQLWDEIHNCWKRSVKDLSPKELAGHIMTCHDEFSHAAHAWHNLEDIHVFGVVVYSGADEAADVNAMVDYLSTLVKHKRFEGGSSIPPPRFGYSADQFAKLGVTLESCHIPWKTMLDVLYTHEVCILHWPARVPAVGPDFAFKDLKPAELKALTTPYLKSHMGDDYHAEEACIKATKKLKKKEVVPIPEEQISF